MTRSTRSAVVLLIMNAALGVAVVVVLAIDVNRQHARTVEAFRQTDLAIAQSKIWKAGLDAALSTSEKALDAAQIWKDQFLVCNSMLPKDQRM